MLDKKEKSARSWRKLDFARPRLHSGLGVFVLSALYTASEYILIVNFHKEKPFGEIAPELFFHFVVVAGLGLILSFIVEIVESVHTLDNLARQFEGSLTQIRKNVHSAINKERTRFMEQHQTETIGKFLQEWYKELENALVLSLDDKRFTVLHEVQALRSYEIFWRHLVKEQEARPKQPLTVLIIHSSSFDIWSKYAISEKLLRSQKSFCELGGNITRILCATGEPSDDVKKVAAKMKESHVKVHYYDISTAKVDFDFAWDFLYVKETETAVIWDSFNTGANIKESTYQVGNEFRDHNLEDLWRNIDKTSKEI